MGGHVYAAMGLASRSSIEGHSLKDKTVSKVAFMCSSEGALFSEVTASLSAVEVERLGALFVAKGSIG